VKILEILQAIGARLELITVDNGYYTDLGSSVVYFRDIDAEYGMEPVLTFRDADNVLFASENNYHEANLPIEIEAIAFGENVMDLGVQMFADIIKAVGLDTTWGGLALKTDLVSSYKNVETKGRRAVRVDASILITYRVPKWTV
jgi:hypothetical protein